ncbi:MAG TPA: histidine kinase [Pyrinomonadaceae bacterium]|nr:histidine kinase [Pyrinomonadaceae bacterium]
MKKIRADRLSSLAGRFKLIESLDDRMIATMRLVLAGSALVVIYLDPAEPDHLVQETYGALVLYVLYSVALYIDSVLSKGVLGWRRSWAHWIDVLWYTLLIGLSSGTNSIFFFFYFFSILVASFRWGFRSGTRITIASFALFTTVGYVTAPSNFELNRFLLRPIYLLVLGYMIAYWGGFEVELRRRLKFLKDIARLSNPRFGVDRTITWAMEQLLSFYDADSCLLILSNAEGTKYSLRRVRQDGDDASASNEPVDSSTATVFLSGSPTEALIHTKHSTTCLSYHTETAEVSVVPAKNALNALLSDESFLSVPVTYRGDTIGRCYVVGGKSRFTPSDAEFLLQTIDQVIPLLDNIRLVDHMASDAANHERERIARDIHDSVIQPYIGLQLGLTALGQKMHRGDKDVLDQMTELSELTAKSIADLRQYVGNMKSTERNRRGQLLPALDRFCSRFSQATGIKVQILASENLNMNDRLAGEVFQLVAEGLSNVRRHTNAQFAITELQSENGTLVIRIENENRDNGITKSFQPRSMAERVDALGGKLVVDTNGNTVVRIEIPL